MPPPWTCLRLPRLAEARIVRSDRRYRARRKAGQPFATTVSSPVDMHSHPVRVHISFGADLGGEGITSDGKNGAVRSGTEDISGSREGGAASVEPTMGCRDDTSGADQTTNSSEENHSFGFGSAANITSRAQGWAKRARRNSIKRGSRERTMLLQLQPSHAQPACHRMRDSMHLKPSSPLPQHAQPRQRVQSQLPRVPSLAGTPAPRPSSACVADQCRSLASSWKALVSQAPQQGWQRWRRRRG